MGDTMPAPLLNLPKELILLILETGSAQTENPSSAVHIYTYALRSTCRPLHALIPPPKPYSFDDAIRNLPPRTKGGKPIRSMKRAHTENMLTMERWRCHYTPTPAILKDLDESCLKPCWFARIAHDQVGPQYRDKLSPRSLHFCRPCQKLRPTELFAVPQVTGHMAKERLPCKKSVRCDVRQKSPASRYCIDCLVSIAYVDVWSPHASPVHYEYDLPIDTVNEWGSAEAGIVTHLRCVACTACLGSIDTVYQSAIEGLGEMNYLVNENNFRRLAVTRYAKSQSKFDSCNFKRATGGLLVHEWGILIQTGDPIILALGFVFDIDSTDRINQKDIKERLEGLLRCLADRLQKQAWSGEETTQCLFLYQRMMEKMNLLPWSQTK